LWPGFYSWRIPLRSVNNTARDLLLPLRPDETPLKSGLTALLYRGIIDCCEQLLQLEPKDASHTETLAFYTNAMGGIKERSASSRTRLESAQQIKDAHHLLHELARFVQQQVSLKKINSVQLDAYTDQINRLLLQLTVDSHLLSAKAAQQAGKHKLVLHHYTLARKALASDNGHQFKQHIAKLDAAIATLKESLAPKDAAPLEEAPLTSDKAWKEFDEENEKWHRKQIYDE
jgi:hypothetical protein